MELLIRVCDCYATVTCTRLKIVTPFRLSRARAKGLALSFNYTNFVKAVKQFEKENDIGEIVYACIRTSAP